MRRLWSLAVALLTALLLPAAGLRAQPVAVDLVHQAMDEVLLETGNPFLRVIKQGSWITGEGYRNPLALLEGASDHDARLFIALDDVPPEKARATWITFKRRLQGRVTALARGAGYGTEATQRLLRSINLYPPGQLFKDIANNEQALAAFWRAGNYPSLLEVGEEGAEGLYTKATKFIRQRYEMGSRVSVSALVANEGDDLLTLVRRGNANLEHMIEGIARENLEGYLQATEYTMLEAQKALRQGNLELAQKNIKRMAAYHEGASRMAGTKPLTALRQELDRLKTTMDSLIERAFGEAVEVKALLRETRAVSSAALVAKAHVELAALEGMVGRQAIRQRAFYKGILEAEGRWAALRQEMEAASQKMIVAEGQTAGRLLMKHWVTGLFALWEMTALPEAIRKEGVSKATARLAMTVASLASLHVMLLDIAAKVYMYVGELLVDYVASFGYDALASRQDCGNLMAGIYTVPGREANIVENSCEQVQGDRQLACRVYDHNGLRRLLNAGREFKVELLPPLLPTLLGCHARAAAKHYDDVDSRHDSGVAEALMNRCMEPVVRTWLQSRQLVVDEIGAIRQAIAESPLRLQAQPARLAGRGVVRFSAQETMNLPAAEKDLGERAACIGGVRARTVFLHDHEWTVDGKRFASSYDKPTSELNLNAPGQYEVCVTQRVRWHLSGVPPTAMEDGLQGEVSRRGCTNVTVDPAPAPAAAALPGGAPGTTPPGAPTAPPAAAPPVCSYEYGAWGECDRGSRKQQRPLLRSLPAGCVQQARPVLEQACNPGPSEQDKRNGYFNCMCRCSSGWAGHIGVYYDPEQKAVPECKSTGPCIGGLGAFGCSRRHSFNAAADCAKGCWEGAFGAGSYDPARAKKMLDDENRKYKVPLKLTLEASKNPADFGDIVTLTAKASDGAGGYKYAWGGCAQDGQDATARVVNTRSCQACQARVTVTDAEGDSASAGLTIQCNALRVQLLKDSPRDSRIPLGGKASFTAQAFVGERPVTEPLFFVWERNPDVLFGDPRNPTYETRGNGQSRQTATFNRPGTVPVWVNVLKEVEGRKMTMGESAQIVIEVVRPELRLSALPQEPLVGQEVRVTVNEEPRLSDDAVSFWWEVSGPASGGGAVPNVANGRAYSFKATGEQPVTVTVHAKARDGGQEVGVQRLTVNARRTGVTVSGPRVAGPPPMIWKEGVGLVPAGQQVAEHQRVEFSATVAPDPGQPLRYAWSTSPQGCTVSAPVSRETGVTCSRAGSYAVTVVVRNADGAVLGTGQGTLEVTITQAQITRGQQKDQAARLLDQARTLWGQGRTDEALARLDQARAIDKELAAPVVQQAVDGLKKLASDALAKGDGATALKRAEQAQRLAPNDGQVQQLLQKARAAGAASRPAR